MAVIGKLYAHQRQVVAIAGDRIFSALQGIP
jgi:hypothetical protein